MENVTEVRLVLFSIEGHLLMPCHYDLMLELQWLKKVNKLVKLPLSA
jgi:hypothetical protein